MKHELFKVFSMTEGDGPNQADLEEFLTSGKVTPLSVSADVHSGLLIIGYAEEATTTKFALNMLELGELRTMQDKDIEQALNDEAKSVNGFICQSVTMTGGDLMAFVLHEVVEEEELETQSKD